MIYHPNPPTTERKPRIFSLNPAFLEEFKDKQPEWGPVGYFTFKRCVDTSTPVLCDDLQWRQAGSLKEGQGIIGFDEEAEGQFRHVRTGRVLHNKIEKAETVGIELEDGTILYATPDHPWLAKLSDSDNRLYWKKSEELGGTHKNGDVHLLRPFGPVWGQDQTFEGGFLSAAFDGEGCFDRLNSLSFIQVDNAMLRQVEGFLDRRHVPFKKSPKAEVEGRQQCFVLRVNGRRNFIPLLGALRPPRLLEVFKRNLGEVGGDMGAMRCEPGDYVKVVRVFPAGERDIAVLSTDIGTHFTGGFASHNTYARRLCNCVEACSHPTEEFWQTCQRVVEGCFNIQKVWCRTNGLEWNEPKAQRSAQDMFMRMWEFKFTPPGRGLWMMGTDLLFEKGSAALQNCAFTSTNKISEDFSAPFCFLMDMSMLGVGVGGDTRGAGSVTVLPPKTTMDMLVVEDSREGWVELVRTVLNSFVHKSAFPLVVDYSKVRPRGAPIRGFGGIASGAAPLKKLVEGVTGLLLPKGMFANFAKSDDTADSVRCLFEGNGKPYRITSSQIVDVFNYIGKCVVAGGVRRCLPKGTLVHTSTGLVPIEEVVVGAEVMTSQGLSRVTDWVEQGVQPISQVVTQMGVFEATDKHKIAVISDVGGGYSWKKLHDLEPGDRMVFVDRLIEGVTTDFPSYLYDPPKHSTTCTDITIPKLNVETAWLLGLLFGDGYVNDREVSIAVAGDQGDIAIRAMSCLRLFGVNVTIQVPCEGDQCFKVRVKSKQLAEFLGQYKQPKTTLVVPDIILRGLPEVRAAFVAGLLDADGSAKNRPLVVAASVYPSFLEGVQAVLASLGVPSRFSLHKDKSREGNGWQPLFHLTIVGEKALASFVRRVASHSLKYTETRETARSQYDYGFPSEMALEGGVTGWGDGRMQWSRSSRQITVARLENLTGRDVVLVPVEVFDVEHHVREEETYDISVEAGEFVAQGGYLVHNTAEIMFGEAGDPEFIGLKSNSDLLPLYERKAALEKKIADRGPLVTVDYDVDVAELAEVEARIAAHPLNDRRWASNNSIFGHVGMDYTEIAKQIAENGEPGVFWIENARRFSRMGDPADNKDDRVMGTNPCVTGDTLVFTGKGPVRADKLVGRPFHAIVDGGAYRCEGFFQTGVKPVFLLQTKEGHSIRVTADHQILMASKVTRKKRYEVWVEAQDLEPGDKVVLNNVRTCESSTGDSAPLEWAGLGTAEEGWLFGNLLGDGHFHTERETATLQFWGSTKEAMLDIALRRIESLGGDPRYHQMRTGSEVADRDMVTTGSRRLWKLALEFGISHAKEIINDNILMASSAFQSAFLRGLFDADGSVQGSQAKGVSVRLSSSNRQHLTVAQRMLMHFGINSTIYWNRREEGTRLMPDGKGNQAPYDCEAQHELVVSNDNIAVFADRIGFDDPEKKATLAGLLGDYKRSLNRERFVAMVESVIYVGVEPVFDGTVEGVHRFGANGITVHNCGEQSLESFELCNLVETYPAHHDDFEDFQRTLKMAYLYAKTVTLVPTHDFRANQVMQYNRRIGCSMSGIVQARQKLGHREFVRWCDEGYGYIRELDHIYSRWLGVPNSKKMTSVKPSGTVSLLCGASPGIHFPHSQFYIRRIRVANTDPLVEAAKKAGYHVEPDRYADDTSVVSFPVEEKHFSKGKNDVSIWEQFTLAAALQKHWADNQVSVTVTFKSDEAEEIATCLSTFEDQLKSISMLPVKEHGYEQAPYEEIDEATYERMAARITLLDLSTGDFHDKDAEDKFCSNDSCTVDFSKAKAQ